MMATLGEDMSSRDECDVEVKVEAEGSNVDGARWGAIGLVFVPRQIRIGMATLCHQSSRR